MNHKIKGFLLFEFLMTSLLASALLIIVYQSYKTANKGVQYIRNNADFQMQKILLQYQLELDAMHIVLPDFLYNLYPAMKDHFYKKNNKKSENNNKDDDKAKKILENDFKLASIFFPELIKTEQEIKISWISSRRILNKDAFIKINYILKLSDKVYKEKKLYQLYRREDILDTDYSIKKHGGEYIFITYILDPEVYFIMPKINLVKKENESMNIEKKSLKEEKNDFILWKKDPAFIAETTVAKIDFQNMHKKTLVPFLLLINGVMVAYNLSKELDLQITISFPIADYALQIFFNYENDKELLKNNNIEKNASTMIKVNTSNTSMEKPLIEVSNNF